MPETTLRDTVLKRLDAAADDDNDWYPLVLAALEGAQELQEQLDAAKAEGQGQPSGTADAEANGKSSVPALAVATATATAPPRIAFLSKLTVEGFRGIGQKATLDLTPGPGLTLVVGRNGSGKSSFAEGLELLLTGGTYRWLKRSEVWKGGWRNLHHKTTSLVACLALEGEKGPCMVVREWAEGQELEDGDTTAQVHGKPKGRLQDLGWTDALASCRPFLSYNELGSMLDEGPSKLYDALAKILGIDDLVQASEALQQERTNREKALLAPLADERAKKAVAALQKKDDWSLDEVEAIVCEEAYEIAAVTH
jgi:hypothetical protein